MEFSGRLAAFPMSALLQWAANERPKGILVVRRSQREKWIQLANGQIVGCLSDDPAEFYGQHLLLHGHLSPQDLVAALTFCQQHEMRLGEALCRLRLLDEATVQRTLRRQIEDSVADLFLWEHGVFYFREETVPEQSLLPESIDSLTLSIEGSRWLDDYRRIRQVFVNDSVEVARRAGQAPAEGPLEARILAELGAPARLGDLYARVKGSYFRFLEAAFALAVREAIDIVEVGETPSETADEPSVYDLLFEQAAEEQAPLLRRSLSIPFDLIERFYPVWVADPLAAGAEEALPDKARQLFSRFDGKSSLREILDRDPALRGRQIELLLLHLRQGNLALLPAPFPEIDLKSAGNPAAQSWWRKLLR